MDRVQEAANSESCSVCNERPKKYGKKAIFELREQFSQVDTSMKMAEYGRNM
jgi:hypothetical protein